MTTIEIFNDNIINRFAILERMIEKMRKPAPSDINPPHTHIDEPDYSDLEPTCQSTPSTCQSTPSTALQSTNVQYKPSNLSSAGTTKPSDTSNDTSNDIADDTTNDIDINSIIDLDDKNSTEISSLYNTTSSSTTVPSSTTAPSSTVTPHTVSLPNLTVDHSMLHRIKSVYQQSNEVRNDNKSNIPTGHEQLMDRLDSIERDLQKVSDDYFLHLSGCFLEYKKLKNTDTYNNFVRTLLEVNTLSNLDTIYGELVSACTDRHHISKLERMYNELHVTPAIMEKKETKCTCGEDMYMDPVRNILLCCKCGASERVFVLVVEEEQSTANLDHKTKQGKYDPIKHCKIWMDRIQGREVIDIPKELIQGIKAKIRRDNIYLETITCQKIRTYLKELQQSGYNNNIPYIHKCITSIDPPQLSETELNKIYKDFANVMNVYKRIKPRDKPNSLYHPYFIYKIIEQRFKGDPVRCRNILSYIHMQSRETIIGNDMIWREMCELLDFTYQPTEW